MAVITLIDKQHASEGKEFFYLGPLEECAECRFSKVCTNLEQGSKYRVTAVREQDHECPGAEDEPVTVVEVEKIPVAASVGKRQAMEGSRITYKGSECGNMACPKYSICHPEGKVPGEKYAVQKVEGDLECPLGEKLVLVQLF